VFDEALNMAEKVHPRAADAYFTATARLTNSILIPSGRLMVMHSVYVSEPLLAPAKGT
jgi:hypothetical protein